MIDLIINNKNVYNIVQIIYIQDIFLFIYNIHEKIEIKKDYLDPSYNINNLKVGIKVVVEFKINLQNFKVIKKIDIIKTYLFYLLKIYLIDKLNKKIILTLKKMI